MKNLKILALLPALLITSCKGKDKFAGTYQFRMGKSDGNHMEVTAVLSDKQDSKVEGYKIMNLTADFGEDMDPTKELDDLEAIAELIAPAIEVFFPEIGDKLPALIGAAKEEVEKLKDVECFYKVTDYKHAKYGNRLEIGTHAVADMLSSIDQNHPELHAVLEEIKNLAFSTGLVREDMYVMPDKAKYVFNGFVNKKALTIQIPVSKEDLKHQLFWYGFNVKDEGEKLLPDNYMDRMPGIKGENRFGTHPAFEMKNNVVVKDEATLVNDEFAYEFSKTKLYVSDDITDEEELGRFALKDANNQKQLSLIIPGNTTGGIFEGYVGLVSRKLIKLQVNEKGVCEVTPNGKTGIKEGFTDLNGAAFTYNDLMSTPYQFRDFNIVNVGLSKIS